MKTISICRLASMVLVLGTLAVYGCGGDSKSPTLHSYLGDDRENMSENTPESGMPVFQKPIQKEEKKQDQPLEDGKKKERKIVYTAEMRMIVEDLDKSQTELTALIQKYEGLVAEQDIRGKKGSQRSATWKVRIPPKSLDEFRTAVVKLGEPEHNILKSLDVTGEYYDLEAHIKNAQEEEKRLKDHLKQDTKDLKDILAVEKEISRVRGQIEVLQGKMKVMQDLTGLTTVTITFFERKDYVPPEAPAFGTTIGRTFQGSVDNLVKFGQGLVLGIVALVPWLPVIAVFGAVVWWIVRRTHKRGEGQKPVTQI